MQRLMRVLSCKNRAVSLWLNQGKHISTVSIAKGFHRHPTRLLPSLLKPAAAIRRLSTIPSSESEDASIHKPLVTELKEVDGKVEMKTDSAQCVLSYFRQVDQERIRNSSHDKASDDEVPKILDMHIFDLARLYNVTVSKLAKLKQNSKLSLEQLNQLSINQQLELMRYLSFYRRAYIIPIDQYVNMINEFRRIQVKDDGKEEKLTLLDELNYYNHILVATKTIQHILPQEITWKLSHLFKPKLPLLFKEVSNVIELLNYLLLLRNLQKCDINVDIMKPFTHIHHYQKEINDLPLLEFNLMIKMLSSASHYHSFQNDNAKIDPSTSTFILSLCSDALNRNTIALPTIEDKSHQINRSIMSLLANWKMQFSDLANEQQNQLFTLVENDVDHNKDRTFGLLSCFTPIKLKKDMIPEGIWTKIIRNLLEVLEQMENKTGEEVKEKKENHNRKKPKMYRDLYELLGYFLSLEYPVSDWNPDVFNAINKMIMAIENDPTCRTSVKPLKQLFVTLTKKGYQWNNLPLFFQNFINARLIDRCSRNTNPIDLLPLLLELQNHEECLTTMLWRFTSSDMTKDDLPETIQKELLDLIETKVKLYTIEEFPQLISIVDRLAGLEYTWDEVPSIVKEKLFEFLNVSSPNDVLQLASSIALLSFDHQEDLLSLFQGPYLAMHQRLVQDIWEKVDQTTFENRNGAAIYLAWLQTFPESLKKELLLHCPHKTDLPTIEAVFEIKRKTFLFFSLLRKQLIERNVNVVSPFTLSHNRDIFAMHLAIRRPNSSLGVFIHIVRRKTAGKNGVTIDRQSHFREHIYKHYHKNAAFIRVDKKQLFAGDLMRLAKDVEEAIVKTFGPRSEKA